MAFFKLEIDWICGRRDGEHWAIRSEGRLKDFLRQMSGALPRAGDLERLNVFVYSDIELPDVLSGTHFSRAFFVSERLKKTLDGFRLPADQFHFLEKPNVE